jgi:ribosomal protein S18 acetylase RimI-like enzyme
MDVDIKILRAGDEPLLEAVADGVFDDEIDPRAAAKFLANPNHHIAVAIEDGTVVAFASGVHYHHPDAPTPELFIKEVSVAASHQRRGIGKAIVQALLGVARELACSEAWVLTDRDNLAAMRLYFTSGGEEALKDQVMFSFDLQA